MSQFLEKDELVNELKSSYRKWKSASYFDSFSMIDACEVAFFEEKERISENDEYFENLADSLLNAGKREILFTKIIDSINVRCFPKKFFFKNSELTEYAEGEVYDNETNHQNGVFSNIPEKSLNIEKFQYFIDLSITGHILGVLWILTLGKVLDSSFDEQSYGNRLRKNIVDSKSSNDTPYLFYPYFKKYESWRDKAIDITEGLLDLGLNAVMISLDVTGYFYNCRIDFNKLKSDILKNIKNKNIWKKYGFLNIFIELIFNKYFNYFETNPAKNDINKPMVPIGFLPSNIISNWFLHKFDSEIRKQLNPQYYGRYVDDILLVFSVNDSTFNNKNKKNEFLNLLYENANDVFNKEDWVKKKEISINSKYLQGSNKKLELKGKKIKVFYFSHENSRQMLETFKSTIQNNSSVFLYLHEDEKEIIQNLGQEIWSINYSDSIQKIRSIDDLLFNKFKLSKWLAFLVHYSGTITLDDFKKIEKILFETLQGPQCLQNFTLWEKYFTIFLKNNQFHLIKKMCVLLLESIENVTEKDSRKIESAYLINNDEIEVLKTTLIKYLISVLYKVLTLKNCKEVEEIIDFLLENPKIGFNSTFRSTYLSSFMFNNQIILYPLSNYKILITNNKIVYYDLFSIDSVFHYSPTMDYEYLKYYPRYIHYHEIQMLILGFPFQENSNAVKEENYKLINRVFGHINYRNENIPLVNSEIIKFSKDNDKEIYKGRIGDTIENNEIKVGIANVNIDATNFESVLKQKSQFISSTRQTLSEIINSAIEAKVDILVLPECYIHRSWIPKLIRVARDHQMAMIFGMEHQIKNSTAYNYLVTLLPFKTGQFNNCILEMRLKNHYSPFEIECIENYFLSIPPKKDPSYTMYSWKGFSFVPYCCYEICSIEDRAIFKSFIDAVFVIEWNRDLDYFSNIIESLSRDLHCYCIQVNSSDFGDSRITQPTKRELKDIVRAKGGENAYLIVGKINIEEIREFQIKGYQLQKQQENKTGKYKPTPPRFDPEKVKDREK